MDQNLQLYCSQVDHNMFLIEGICMRKSCAIEQRMYCSECLKTIHVDCHNSLFKKQQFIDQLSEYKFKHQYDPYIKSILRDLAQRSYQFIKDLEDLVNDNINNNFDDNRIYRMDQILSNQNRLSREDWNEGYKFLTEDLGIVVQITAKLLNQVDHIKKSIDQIRLIKKYFIYHFSCQPMLKLDWNLVTQDKPLVIKTSHKICTIAQSPNGQYIASAGFDKFQIQIWDPMNGKLVQKLKGHSKQINEIQFSKCGNFIVSASNDTTLIQWNVFNQNKIAQIMKHENYVTGVKYSFCQKYIVSSSNDKNVKIWDSKSGKEHVGKAINHTDLILCLSLSPIQSHVVFGDDKGFIIIFDYENHQQVGQSILGHTNWVYSLQYSPDERLILSGGHDRTVRIFDSKSIQQIAIFNGHSSEIQSVGFSPNMKYLISGGRDQTVRIWDRTTGKRICENLRHHKEFIFSVQFSLDGRYLISGGFDQIMNIQRSI